MTPALWLLTLLVGLVLGWQGCRAVTAFVTHRHGAGSSGPGQGRGPTATSAVGDGPGPELDLRDHPLYDQAQDPGLELAACRLCHGKGRVWTIDGTGQRCVCGTTPAGRVISG